MTPPSSPNEKSPKVKSERPTFFPWPFGERKCVVYIPQNNNRSMEASEKGNEQSHSPTEENTDSSRLIVDSQQSAENRSAEIPESAPVAQSAVDPQSTGDTQPLAKKKFDLAAYKAYRAKNAPPIPSVSAREQSPIPEKRKADSSLDDNRSKRIFPSASSGLSRAFPVTIIAADPLGTISFEYECKNFPHQYRSELSRKIQPPIMNANDTPPAKGTFVCDASNVFLAKDGQERAPFELFAHMNSVEGPPCNCFAQIDGNRLKIMNIRSPKEIKPRLSPARESSR